MLLRRNPGVGIWTGGEESDTDREARPYKPASWLAEVGLVGAADI